MTELIDHVAAIGRPLKRKVKKAIKKYQINDVTAAEAGNTEGSG